MKCIQCGDDAGPGLLRNGPDEPLCAACFDAGPQDCGELFHAFDFNENVCRCGRDIWGQE